MIRPLLAALGLLSLGSASSEESIVPRSAWIDRDAARLELVDALDTAGESSSAERELRAMLRDRPADAPLRIRLAQILAKRKDAVASRAEFERALAAVPPTDAAWLAYAARLGEWGDFLAAERIIRRQPPSRKNRRLLAATLAGAQQFEEAAVLAPQPSPARSARPVAPEIELETLGDVAPGDISARLRRAELLAATRRFDEAAAELDAIDAAMPGHSKAALLRARALSWQRNYHASLAAYDAILAANPTDPIARLEKARVAAWAKRMGLSQRAYRALWDDPTAVPRRRETARLEAQAKLEAWHRHFLRASRTLENLTALQPDNQEAWFDLAQAQSALGLSDRSAQAYDTLLDLDPLHRMAAVGRAQNALDARPAALASYWYWDEKGTGRLSDITRQRIRAGGEFSLPSRFDVRAFAESWIEQPDDGNESFFAQGFALEGGGAITDWLSFAARYAFKAYVDPDLAPTNTGGASLTANLDDLVTLTLGYAREDEIHNRFSLFQGTQADAYALEARSVPFRQLELTGRFVLRRYSDDNWQQDLKADIGFLLLDHPHSLKLVLTGQYLNTQRQSIFLTGANSQTEDVTYPYWTPRAYFRGLVGLEWRHDLARDFFAGAPRHYYGLVVRGGTDTDRNASIGFLGEYLVDLTPRWTFQAQGGVERSAQWNGTTAFASLTYRF